MRLRLLAIAIAALFAIVPPASASVIQRVWASNYQGYGGGAQKNNVMWTTLAGDVGYGPDLGTNVLAISGWGSSLYVGAGTALIRTDLDGNSLEARTSCANVTSLAVSGGSLYAACAHGAEFRSDITRFALNNDGSLGASTVLVTTSYVVSDLAVANGYIYVSESLYKAQPSIGRIPLLNPAALDENWYPTTKYGALAVDGERIYLADASGTGIFSGSSSDPGASPLTTLPPPSVGLVNGLAVRGDTLFIATMNISVATDSYIWRQATAAPATPTIVHVWPSGGGTSNPMPSSLYPGNQEQTWSTDTADHALAAGAFAAPITASSGLTPTIASSTPAVCSVSGTTVTPLAAGVCALTADQAGNAAYLAAPTGSVYVRITAPASTPTATLSKPKLVGNSIVTSISVTSAGHITQSGTVSGRGRAAKATTICTATATAKKAGVITLTCRLARVARDLLAKKALAVTLTTVFTPTGSAKQSTTQRLKIPRAHSVRGSQAD
jgi:hypothetical protein